MGEIKDLIKENIKDFKEFFSLPKDKKERKEFILTFIAGSGFMFLAYIFFMLFYFSAPQGYWNGF